MNLARPIILQVKIVYSLDGESVVYFFYRFYSGSVLGYSWLCCLHTIELGST